MTFERRYANFEYRETDDESGALEGYAAVFDQETELFDGFYEVVRRSAFDRTIENGFDTRALFNHDDNIVLGRIKAGTLSLSTDDHGLKVRIKPPQSAAGVVESIKRGDIDQMSFGFVSIKDEVTSRSDGTRLRELKEVKLYDVSPVTFPAYPTTEVQARRGLYIHDDQEQELRGRLMPEEEIEDPRSTAHSIVTLRRRQLQLVELAF